MTLHGVPIHEQTAEDLLWISEEFLAHERFVVHGLVGKCATICGEPDRY
jgi:hypothetical protein